MTAGNLYRVTKEIKLHTNPLHKEKIVKTGVYVKETEKTYVFDKFKVNKRNVVRIEEMGQKWDEKTIMEFVRRLEEHYPHSNSVVKTIKKVAGEMLEEEHYRNI